eukprot:939254-Rhodomonas_salina.2
MCGSSGCGRVTLRGRSRGSWRRGWPNTRVCTRCEQAEAGRKGSKRRRKKERRRRRGGAKGGARTSTAARPPS